MSFQTLQSDGLTLLRHRPVHTDPFVLRQRWLVTPTGRQHHEKAFYRAFDQREFRQALSFLLAAHSYTQNVFSDLSQEQFTFLEEQEFLVKAPSSYREEYYRTLGIPLANAEEILWTKGSACQHISNIGHTLEWYVAEYFRDSYQALARHGVEIKELTVGGDLDVVALKDGKRILVECKSSLFPYRRTEIAPLFAAFNRFSSASDAPSH